MAGATWSGYELPPRDQATMPTDETFIYDEEYWPPPAHPLRLVVALAILLAITAVCLSWFAATAGIAGGSSSTANGELVPGVDGKDEATAVAELSEAGFDAEVVRERNVIVPAGTVFAQDPRGGLVIPTDEPIRLRVSAGDAFVVTPQVTGSMLDELSSQLAEFGLTVGEVGRQEDSTSLAGVVLEQLPVPGAEVPVGTAIDVVVSEGPPPRDVPAVVGLPEDEAVYILGSAGFRVNVRRVHANTRVGHVAWTTPRPGTEAPYGSSIVVNVSRGPAPAPPPTAPTTPEDPPDAESTPPPSPPDPPPAGESGGNDGGGNGGGAGDAAGDGEG